MTEMPDKEFKTLLLKMINDNKEDSNKQVNEIIEINSRPGQNGKVRHVKTTA
jgi:hypothetical protein